MFSFLAAVWCAAETAGTAILGAWMPLGLNPLDRLGLGGWEIDLEFFWETEIEGELGLVGAEVVGEGVEIEGTGFWLARRLSPCPSWFGF